MKYAFFLFVLLLGVITVGCGDNRRGLGDDTGTELDADLGDATSDTNGADAGTDASADAGTDATADTSGPGTDAMTDTSRDAREDAPAADASRPGCAAEDLCDGEGGDEDCDGSFDEGCGECAISEVACVEGCCEVPETEIAEDGDFADIDVDARGNVYVVYTLVSGGPWRTRLARFDAETSRWSDQELGSAQGSNRAVVEVDDAGDVHVLLAGRDGAITYQRSSDGGRTFTARPNLPGTLGTGGTIDLVMAGDTPHVVYMRENRSVWNDLIYAVWNGSTWTTEQIDERTTGISHPRLAVGFGERPFIVYEAYEPSGSDERSSLRLAFDDGASLRFEDIDVSQGIGRSREYFNRAQVDITDGDELRVSYTRGVSTIENVYATRTRAGSWSERVLPLGTDVENATLAYQEDGRLVVVSDGLMVHQDVRGSWSTALPMRRGEEPAIHRVGDFLYLAYGSTVSRDPLMFARVRLR